MDEIIKGKIGGKWNNPQEAKTRELKEENNTSQCGTDEMVSGEAGLILSVRMNIDFFFHNWV